LGLDGIVYSTSPSGGAEEAYEAAYVTGLENLLAAVGGQSLRVILTSSTAVYGQSDGEWVDETSTTEPASATARVVLAGERLLAASGLSTTSVRFGGIYGPGRTRLIERVRRGGATLSAPSVPPQFTNRVHVDDCAGILRHLLGLSDIAATYNGVDSDPATADDVDRWLATELGVSLGQGTSSTPETGGLRGNKRCSNARLLASGYTFIFPTFREGYGDLLRGHTT
jgi:nucleoside-diphosphate-sugar epimerase